MCFNIDDVDPLTLAFIAGYIESQLDEREGIDELDRWNVDDEPIDDNEDDDMFE